VADLPFAAVQVDPAGCSACGLCARLCPTGALQFTAEENHFTLSFQAAICIDCPICTVACPEDAVRLGETLAVIALVSEEWQSLVTGQLTPCTQCGVPTAVQAGESTPARCYACRQGAGAVQPLRDEAGLMADLLARVPKAVPSLNSPLA
jgi:ferredoxin